ncbi:DNA repair protein complementing XP-A cells-like [Holothuria leucospilota]|uniref:DNA repair protein complementing XP-A cells-like n=1 Tax=Holothuria leucospilota TaxID=206669 RepID=A0A9Q1BNB3_HOLLE|nr:DNA repair protein complementing XP-A cells-like [Holothuria leucospilota]
MVDSSGDLYEKVVGWEMSFLPLQKVVLNLNMENSAGEPASLNTESDNSMAEGSIQSSSVCLSDAQKAKIEKNRQKALALRRSREGCKPYTKKKPEKKQVKIPEGAIRLPGGLLDTNAGFLIDEEEVLEEKELSVIQEPGPLLGGDLLRCLDCGNSFQDSSLYKQFDHSVCDDCRDNEDKHNLITKTEAKNEYLLKDADLDRREPPLKFLVRKNPHNPRWGDMKLYLRLQV